MERRAEHIRSEAHEARHVLEGARRTTPLGRSAFGVCVHTPCARTPCRRLHNASRVRVRCPLQGRMRSTSGVRTYPLQACMPLQVRAVPLEHASNASGARVPLASPRIPHIGTVHSWAHAAAASSWTCMVGPGRARCACLRHAPFECEPVWASTAMGAHTPWCAPRHGMRLSRKRAPQCVIRDANRHVSWRAPLVVILDCAWLGGARLLGICSLLGMRCLEGARSAAPESMLLGVYL